MLPDVKIWDCKGDKYLLFEKNDVISDALKSTSEFGGDLIRITTLLCSALTRPLVLDIGANIGSFTIPVAKHLATLEGELHAFEPQRIPFYQLCSNVILNRLENAYLHNYAIGEHDSTIEIYEAEPNIWNSGAYSLYKEYRKAEGIDNFLTAKTTTVDLRSLDSTSFSKNVDLIKLDVEGYEIHVINGAKDFLPRNGFPYLIFEAWNTNWFSERKNQLLETVSSLGYEILQIDQTNFLAQHLSSIFKVDIRTFNNSRQAFINQQI